MADTPTISRLERELLTYGGPFEQEKPMATHRNRPPRSGNRGTGGSGAEEYPLWEQCKEEIGSVEALEAELLAKLEEFNTMKADFAERESEGKNLPTSKELESLANILREIQSKGQQSQDILSGGAYPLKEKIVVLKAIQEQKETTTAEPLRRGGSSRDGNRADGPSNSPAPSSAMDKEKSSGLKRVVRENRASLPPKDSTTKQDGPTAQSTSSNNGIVRNAKGKIIYAKGDEIAFLHETNWILGTVVSVTGDGKSRRYHVQDIDPVDEHGNPVPPVRTSASSMMPIPQNDAGLPQFAPNTRVLARYPDTTAFYPALVVEGKGETVILRFDGEEEPNKLIHVERRFVLDHRTQTQ